MHRIRYVKDVMMRPDAMMVAMPTAVLKHTPSEVRIVSVSPYTFWFLKQNLMDF